MSKRAEDFALKKWPILISQRSDINSSHRSACIQGYEQAEKDLALTLEDIKTIIRIYWIVSEDKAYHTIGQKDEEVFRRFNEQRK
jgi:hypothetical protein